MISLLVALVLLATPAAAAQRTPKPQDAEAWVTHVCLAVDAWSGAQDEVFADALRTTPAELSPSDARTSLTTTLATLADRTDELVIALERNGAPKVANGKAAATKFVAAFQEVAKGLRTTRDVVKDMPVDDPTQFVTSLDATTEKLHTTLSQVSLDFTKASSGGAILAKAAAKADACKSYVRG